MPRAGLDHAAVVDAAARLADAEGLHAVSFARVAAELRVKPPSLYNHVAGLPALQEALSLRAYGELLEQSRAAIIGRAGPDALVALAHVHRAYAHAHPGLYAATHASLHVGSQQARDLGDTYLSLFTAVLLGFGLEGAAAVHAIRCLRAGITGFIDLEQRGGFGLGLDVEESFSFLISALIDGIQN